MIDHYMIFDIWLRLKERNNTASRTISMIAYLFIRTSFLSIYIYKNKKIGLELMLDSAILVTGSIHLQIHKLIRKKTIIGFIKSFYFLQVITRYRNS